ncbi:MAG: hypothetical protein MPJ50_13825 [Pirellulales bacterium]|nr:hypothetical protein [Pirellulales bacterium]
MHPINIFVKLERHPRVYHPGEMLSGEYRWEVPRAEDVRTVEISVMWMTEGKGKEDIGVHFFDRLSFDVGDDTRPGKARFSTQLPNSPLSYDGFLVKIRWLVRVRLFLGNGDEGFGEREFRLAGAQLPGPLLHKTRSASRNVSSQR